MKTKNITTLVLARSIGRSSCWSGCFAILFAVVYLAFSHTAQALLPAPTPDGAYPTWNTAEGQNALFNRTSGNFNTAIGGRALFDNTTGNANTAVGAFSMFSNSSGDQNTAVGQGALSKTTGNANVGIGFKALFKNASEDGNTAVGANALFNAVTSPENVAVGFNALQSTSGTNGFNVAVGFQALDAVTSGGQNTAVGDNALGNLVSGTGNTAVGDLAGLSYNGGEFGNISIGAFVEGIAGERNTIRIGDILPTTAGQSQCFIGGIFNQAGGTQFVAVNSAGKLGFFTSSRRFKDDIKPMDQASELIYALKPVSFRYKAEIEPSRPLGFGLIAEDVEKVSPDLVLHGGDGKVNSVRYECVNAMLLNEFLKEHRKVQELEATLAEQRKGMETLATQLREQASQIQKVSAQLEVSKPAPQVVGNR